MYSGKLVFAQTMDHLALHTLRHCIQRYDGNHHVKQGILAWRTSRLIVTDISVIVFF